MTDWATIFATTLRLRGHARITLSLSHSVTVTLLNANAKSFVPTTSWWWPLTSAWVTPEVLNNILTKYPDLEIIGTF